MKTQTRLATGDAERVAIYLGESADEIIKLARKLRCSRAVLIARAWEIAKRRIAKMRPAEIDPVP